MKRVLLKGPDCRVWFLSERVRGWKVAGHMRRVPVSPPNNMFHTHLFRGDALDEACLGEDADELCDRRKCRYSEFAHAHLLQRVAPAASTSQAIARGSASQVA